MKIESVIDYNFTIELTSQKETQLVNTSSNNLSILLGQVCSTFGYFVNHDLRKEILFISNQITIRNPESCSNTIQPNRSFGKHAKRK